MTFWSMSGIYCETDYKDTFVNGSLDHPFSLPGVTCDACGTVWAGSRILPIECPESLRKHPRIADACNIPRLELDELKSELARAFEDIGQEVPDLRTGDSFQPCYLDIPSRPRADFLWASIGSLVVSGRIASLLAETCPNDVAICPVSLRKIGKREARLPPPIPATGEPEDIIHEVELHKDVSEIGPYFEVVILHQSGYPPGGAPISYCEVCHRHEINNETREIRMTPDMWNGHQIFHLATTLCVVVTDELKRQLEQMRPTNLDFDEY